MCLNISHEQHITLYLRDTLTENARIRPVTTLLPCSCDLNPLNSTNSRHR